MQKGATVKYISNGKKITCSDSTAAEMKLVAPQQEIPAFLHTAN